MCGHSLTTLVGAIWPALKVAIHHMAVHTSMAITLIIA